MISESWYQLRGGYMGININALKKLNNGYMLVPLIDSFQERAEFPDTWNIEIRNFKKGDKYFHPSGDCLENPITLYEKLMGLATPSKVNYSLRRVFDAGHFWHGYYQEILKYMGLAKEENIERTLTYNHSWGWTAKGTLDIIVDIPRKGQWIVDMKTVNDTEFDEGIRPHTLAKWQAQVNCYMHWTGITDAFILAIRKGGTAGRGGRPMHDLMEIPIQYDPELIDSIYRRWNLVHEAVKRGTPPTVEEIDALDFS